MSSLANLDGLVAPNSVAVIGASDDVNHLFILDFKIIKVRATALFKLKLATFTTMH